MDLTTYVGNLGREFAALAESVGDSARALVDRLSGALRSAIRMTLARALASATDEISREFAPGYVELRLRGREPSFVSMARLRGETVIMVQLAASSSVAERMSSKPSPWPR